MAYKQAINYSLSVPGVYVLLPSHIALVNVLYAKIYFMAKVILKGFIVVHDKDLEAVETELPNHIENTLQEPGCLIFEVNQEQSNKNRFNVYEEFQDKVAFEAHQTRVKNSRWGQITINVERHYEIIE